MSLNWDYYKYIAERCNTEEVVNANGEKELVQQSYSFFSPFYEKQSEDNLNIITKAFLEPKKFKLPKDKEDSSEKLSEEEIRAYYKGCSVKPNDSQYKAIFHAVNDTVTIIQGPPGTGKTETIVNIIRQIYSSFGTTRTVAVVSNNAEAVNNVYSFIENSPLEVDAEIREKFARWGNKERRKEWCNIHGYKPNDSCKFDIALLKSFPFFTSTIHSLRKIFFNMGENLFDYVIIDEATQSSITLGLIAMASAKHLVVLGDDKQLSAIIGENITKPTEEFEKSNGKIDDEHKEKDGNNFLVACRSVFGESATSVLLNQHYRCHPSIIGFCNKYVYDNRLEICTKCENAKEFKIRAVWYEGNYHEKTVDSNNNVYDNDEDKDNSTYGNCNIRQIRIFLEEELPRFNKMNEAYIEKQKAEAPDKEPENLSVGIIAPFKAQLNILKEKLNGMDLEATFEGEESDDKRYGDEEKLQNDVPILTIHKSQGKGYDIVYFMTVVDDNSRVGQWAQRMQMINVAVSRAKKELCVITGNCWMPEKLQKKLTGYILPLPDDSLKENDKYFICKLLGYVNANCPESKGDYGFHKSELTSVFDRVPYVRAKENTGKKYKKFNGRYSAPAICVNNALKENFGEYNIRQEVSMALIKQIQGIDLGNIEQERIVFMKKSRFDFVLCKGKEIKLIIEVDGNFHRNEYKKVKNEFTQPQLDAFKNAWIKDLNAENLFLRLPTNGETDNEIKTIQDMLALEEKLELTLIDDVPEELKPEPKAPKKDLLYRRNKFIWERFGEVKPLIDNKQNGKIGRYFPNLAESVNFKESLTRDFYHCKYSMANSFEFALLWDIILRSYKNGKGDNKLDVCSFDCGSMVEAWSLAYAKARLAEENKYYENLKLSFTGVRLVDWVNYFVPLGKSWFYDNVNLVPENDKVSAKVYIFPKVLNNLNERDFNNMFKRLCFNVDGCSEYYICISHNKSSILSQGKLKTELLNRIHSIISKIAKKFDLCDDIYEMLGDEKGSFLEAWNLGYGDIKDELVEITETPANYGITIDKKVDMNRCYVFKSSLIDNQTVHFVDLNADFSLNKTIKDAFAGLDNDLRPNCVSGVNSIVFQIIRLKKRGN